MVIRADFLMKHICLTGMDAWESICKPRHPQSLAGWFLENGITNVEIEKCFNNWAKIAELDINDPQNLPKFISVAKNICIAREKELNNRFKDSTILYLNDRLYRELNKETTRIAEILFSEFDENSRIPGKKGNEGCKEFNYKPSEPIPLVITINRESGIPTKVFRNVMEVAVGVDSKGNCIHFGEFTGGVAV